MRPVRYIQADPITGKAPEPSATPMQPEIVPEVEPVAEVVVPVEPQTSRYEYQPTDEQGRPLGGRQVILYTTPDELAQKLTDQNVLLIRKLRVEGRKRRLGIDDDSVAENSERGTNLIEFKEKPMSSEQRFNLSQKLNDPEHVKEAIDELFESAIGVPPAKLREILNNQQISELQRRAADNYIEFAQAKIGEGYLDCSDNREIIADWVFKKGLAPSTANFTQAYSTLLAAGLLLGAPVQQQVPPSTPVSEETMRPDLALEPEAISQPPAALVTRIGDTAQPPTTRQSHIPSGLNERTSSASGAAPAHVSGATRQDGTVLTLKEINRMPPDELRKRLSDPAFVQLVEKLETESKQRKAAVGLSKF